MKKRQKYDQFGHDAFQGGGGFSRGVDPFDLFKDVFGGGGGGGFGSIFDDFFGGSSSERSGEGSRGSDLRVSVTITLEQAAKGLRKKLSIIITGSVLPVMEAVLRLVPVRLCVYLRRYRTSGIKSRIH